MATPLQKPMFIKVDQLNPSSTGVNLHAQVVKKTLLVWRKRADGSETKVAEVQIGDETGSINFIVRQENEKLCEEGTKITIRNAKVKMQENNNSSFMQLDIDRWGKVEQCVATVESVNTGNDVSSTEYELVAK